MQKTFLGALIVIVLAFIVLQIAQTDKVASHNRHQRNVTSTKVNSSNVTENTNKTKEIDITPEGAAAAAISSLKASGKLDLDTSEVKENDPAEDEAVVN